MKAKKLIELLQPYKDFDVEFVFSEIVNDKLHVRTFKDLEIADIGYSDKVVLISGEEDQEVITIAHTY